MAKRRQQRRLSIHPGWLIATVALAFIAGFYWARAGDEPEGERQAVEASRPELPAAVPKPAAEAPPAEQPPAAPARVERPAPEAVPPVQPGSARIALVIDDLGRSLDDIDRLERLGIAWTAAVLPFESQTSEVVADLERRGIEYLCHLPMQPVSANPGPGALRVDMTAAELGVATRSALAAVPGAVGVNNHMGSVLSAERVAMRTILGELGSRNLFFLDSRTSAGSVGYELALELGIPATQRQVFLDSEPNVGAVTQQFRRLLDLSRKRGAALAIGHPHDYTLQVLEREVPLAIAAGYEFVPASYLLDRPAVGVTQ